MTESIRIENLPKGPVFPIPQEIVIDAEKNLTTNWGVTFSKEIELIERNKPLEDYLKISFTSLNLEGKNDFTAGAIISHLNVRNHLEKNFELGIPNITKDFEMTFMEKYFAEILPMIDIYKYEDGMFLYTNLKKRDRIFYELVKRQSNLYVNPLSLYFGAMFTYEFIKEACREEIPWMKII